VTIQVDYSRGPSFPFTAIVGQHSMKRALLFNTINPKIGGVLIRGKKGTAKSTAVRSLAELLPRVSVIEGCPYRCYPNIPQGLCHICTTTQKETLSSSQQVRVVDLPVGATEDRLVGSLDIETAIKTGTKSFEPGLIAAANRGILYIDEVNLLNDHLVDVLLDAAAMGRNYVEREGISVSHSAEFILIGTMNPEEGDLRPQLLDRFGLAVEVTGDFTGEERKEVVKRRIAYESDPFGFMASWAEEDTKTRNRLVQSQELLSKVILSEDMLELITDICSEYQVDGLRGDIVMYKTASTIAAYEGRTEVNVEDVREAALMALLHRQRRLPFQQTQMVTDQLDSIIEDHQNQNRNREPQNPQSNTEESEDSSEPDPYTEPDDSDDTFPDSPESSNSQQDEYFEIGDTYDVSPFKVDPPDRRPRQKSGRRANSISGNSIGRYIGAKIPQGKPTDLALDATLRAAAPNQIRRQEESQTDTNIAFRVEPSDIREKVRETRTGSLILFVVDASGSMGAQRRMVEVKGAILSLLLDAYQRRDKVALISFRSTTAELLLPPTNSVDLAQVYLQQMPTGGRTPLSRALFLALDVLDTEHLKDSESVPLVVLLSDGRANVDVRENGSTSEDSKAVANIFRDKRIPAVVIDTEIGFVKLGLAQELAENMGAQYINLESLRSGGIVDTVKSQIPNSDSNFPNFSEINHLIQEFKVPNS
jgi:magnesium chelatase subunit D